MRSRRAFTLVELLVASMMLATLAAAGYAVFSASVHSARRARAIDAMVSRGRRALAAMARDVRSAIRHEQMGMIALDVQYEGLDADTLEFIAHRSRASDDPEAGGLCEIGYYIDNDPNTEDEWLIRREDPTVDDDIHEGGPIVPAGTCVAALNLEFYDGVEWVPDWQPGGELPRAILIGITVVDEAEQEPPLYLETTVSIPAE